MHGQERLTRPKPRCAAVVTPPPRGHRHTTRTRLCPCTPRARAKKEVMANGPRQVYPFPLILHSSTLHNCSLSIHCCPHCPSFYPPLCLPGRHIHIPTLIQNFRRSRRRKSRCRWCIEMEGAGGWHPLVSPSPSLQASFFLLLPHHAAGRLTARRTLPVHALLGFIVRLTNWRDMYGAGPRARLLMFCGEPHTAAMVQSNVGRRMMMSRGWSAAAADGGVR